MNSIGKITEDIINRSPFLRESMSENLINISALARKLQPEIEGIMGKEVREGAIVMAIKRMDPEVFKMFEVNIQDVLEDIGDFLIRSNLSVFSIKNSNTLSERLTDLVNVSQNDNSMFFSLCKGTLETTVVTSEQFDGKMKEILNDEDLMVSFHDLSSITVRLPVIPRTSTHGLYYYILKQLAWEGINILEVVSTSSEFTIIVNHEEVDLAFRILMQMKRRVKEGR